QVVAHCTQLLQRAYRGFQGRAKFRRLQWKRAEYSRLQGHTHARRAQLGALQEWRGQRLVQLQRLYRGWLWRKMLRRLKQSALTMQCAFRVLRAKNRARAEVRRRSEGAPVFPMLGAGRGVHLGGAQFTLQILRCGHNYRLLGVDALRGCTYEGSVHAPEALGLIRAHNQAVAEAAAEAAAVAVRAGGSHPHAHSHSSHSSPIMPWQHERVVELLIGNLGLVPSLQPVTSLMGGNRQQYVLVARPGCIDAPPVQRSATALQLSGPSAQSLGAGVMHMADALTAKQRGDRFLQFRQKSRGAGHRKGGV
ncbi:hypothetical protein B484DRAFT_268146, partial [Ochromonadaceae sp. CCMP2298]